MQQRIHFHKFQGTGNDFIMIDNRDQSFDASQQALIRQMCHRRFGIGADGLILLENAPGYDFNMVYFNADGSEGSMCGNGGRCTVRLHHYWVYLSEKQLFWLWMVHTKRLFERIRFTLKWVMFLL